MRDAARKVMELYSDKILDTGPLGTVSQTRLCALVAAETVEFQRVAVLCGGSGDGCEAEPEHAVDVARCADSRGPHAWVRPLAGCGSAIVDPEPSDPTPVYGCAQSEVRCGA